MPGKKKKKFIDKKNAVTFHLVHRSQRDPLQANDEASQHVLLPVSQSDFEKQKEEQRKYGIFYDDDYDYTQHLKDVNEVYDLVEVETIRVINEDTNLKLPSSVFASEVERDVGLLNQAVPIKEMSVKCKKYRCFKVMEDNHKTCLACTKCSSSHPCKLCAMWAEDIWSNVLKRQLKGHALNLLNLKYSAII